jgi:hypothetical protein
VPEGEVLHVGPKEERLEFNQPVVLVQRRYQNRCYVLALRCLSCLPITPQRPEELLVE